MSATPVSHALGLPMHQPLAKLLLFIETNPWDAERILCCYAPAALARLRDPRGVGHCLAAGPVARGVPGACRSPSPSSANPGRA